MFNTKRYIIILISREIYAAVKNTLLLFLLLCITFLFLHYRLKVTLNYSHFVRYLYYHKKSFRKKKRQMLNHQEYSKFRFFRYSKITIRKFQIIFFPIWTKLLFRLFARRNHSSFAQKKKIWNRWKVSNYAHFQFSNRAFNEITAQPCVTRHRHEKLFEVPRARFPFARVRRKCFGFRAFGRAPGIINHPLPCITYIAGSIVRSVRRGGGEKEKEEEKRKEEDEGEGQTLVESKRNGRGEANLNLEAESEWTARPCARASGLPCPLHGSSNVPQAFNGVFIVARSWRDLIWITNDEQTIVVAFICQNPPTIGSFARTCGSRG